jgi:methylated-DNA-protein-cysteine methyltransferase related protein
VPPVTDDQVEQVRALVAAIPAGRVATYGDIAAAAGLSSPRIVGWIMRTDSSDLPWHRVITASGRPAQHLATRQLELLRAEGVLAVDGRVSLSEVRCELPGAAADDAGPGPGTRRRPAPTRERRRLGQRC